MRIASSCLGLLCALYGVCVWADRRALSQPTPSVCLCANAVLKWAHYHQREHKHSSRKQDSLCQEREPLPQAHSRPDKITRLKIRQGSYYYFRHAPEAAPHSLPGEDDPHGYSNIPFHTFFFLSWLQLELFKHKMLAASCRGCKVCFCQGRHTDFLFSPDRYHHGFSGKFPGAVQRCRDRHYSLIEISDSLQSEHYP